MAPKPAGHLPMVLSHIIPVFALGQEKHCFSSVRLCLILGFEAIRVNVRPEFHTRLSQVDANA